MFFKNGRSENIKSKKESQPDGVTETILEGEKTGLYEWKNGEKYFVRKLTEEEKNEFQKDK